MDISYLVDLIKNDLERNGSYDRYPIRFLSMMYGADTTAAVIQLKSSLDGVDLLDLRTLLRHDDAWITLDKFRQAICGLDPGKSHIVIGFSEYARFLTTAEFTTAILGMLELENPAENPKRRIYVVCFALYSQLKKCVKEYHRRFDAYNPFINETDIEDLPKIYFMADGLNAECEGNELYNSSEWFGMWRNPDIDPTKPIVCSSKTLAYFYNQASPDNVYNIRCLNTYQDILKNMYSVEPLLSYKNDSEGYFKRVIPLVKESSTNDFADIILSEVNTQNVDENNIYSVWKNSDTFKRWLLQNYVIMCSPESTYLHKIAAGLEDLTDGEFLEITYEKIFEYKDIVLVQERNAILNSINRIEKEISFTKRMMAYYNALLTTIVNNKTTLSVEKIDFSKEDEALKERQEVLSDAFGEEIVPYLTDYSSYERQLIIWLYRMHLIDETQVKSIYPMLGNYICLKESAADPEEYAEHFDEYFGSYRNLRLNQQNAEDYDEIISEWNLNEDTFYRWYQNSKIEYPEVYLKKKSFHGNIYVLDGVGAEFLNFIVKVLDDKGYGTDEIAYAKCHLPSTTTVAQGYYPSDVQWIYDFDQKIIHGEVYQHVNNLERALTLIEELLQRILDEEGEEPFAIIADHGASVGHKIRKKDKKYDFDKSEHDGRCYEIPDNAHVENSEDYLQYDDEAGRKWVIALNQQSLYNNSKYVVHGGATLEEVLVPVIIAHKGKTTIKSYKVRALNLEVKGLKRELEFKIIPNPDKVEAVLSAKDGTNVVLQYNADKKTWSGKLKRGIAQDVTVTIGEQVFAYKTVSSSGMGGDDLFDD